MFAARPFPGEEPAVVTQTRQAAPIFLHGISPRSGTNYVWDLLSLHPDVAPARDPVREDFFLECSDHLVAFGEAVRSRWDPIWGDVRDIGLIRRLHACIGQGLIDFLSADPDRRLLAKTPSVKNIGRFFELFPIARLLILIRDGRSVVQSCMSTFGWDMDRSARLWADGAAEVARFRDAGDERYRILRYEDIVDDVAGSIAEVLRFLALDEEAFDFDAAASLPVRGSSALFGPGRSSVHWDPVARPPDFAPKERWRSWSPQMHERFEWIAGRQMQALGYPTTVTPIVGTSRVVRHVAHDAIGGGRTAIRTALFRGRVWVGSRTRPIRARLGLVRREDP